MAATVNLPAIAGLNNASTRRAALLGLAGAAFVPLAVAAAAPAFAEPASSDAGLLRLFDARQTAMRTVYAEGDEPTVSYYENHDRASAAEMAMLNAGANTPKGVAALLWAALPHLESDRWLDEAIAAGDFAAVFAKADALDFGHRLVVTALAALQRMEG